jgi:4-amino-4-deoxy-L-arabinose transferase-like glycosyltransferase
MLPSDQEVAPRHQVAQRRWFWVALITLTALALLLRLYRLDSFPAGIFWDESFEGLDAYSLFGRPFWRWPLFFTAINGREPLFVYLVHFAQRLWGPSVWSVRVVSATAGALLTPAMVWLGWEVAPALSVDHRKQFALWSGFAVLALLWSQTIARLGQRMSLFVLLEILFFAALWHAWRVPKQRWWMLAGIFAGLSFYTYLAVRVIPLLLAIMLGYALLCRRAQLRGRWPGIAISVAAALIVAMPLLLHFMRYPDDFSVRTNQVSLVNTGGIPMLLDNLGRVTGMAFVRGDLNDRLNYPGRPILDAFVLVPFLGGMAFVLRRCWRPGSFFILAGLGCMLLPTLLSDEAPNFGRASGALPFFALLIAVGLDRLLAWASRWRPALRVPGSVVSWGLLLLSTAITAHVYFVKYADLPSLYDSWDTGYTQVAYDIANISEADVSAPVLAYVEDEIAHHPTPAYLLSDQPAAKLPRTIGSLSACLRIAPGTPARYYFNAMTDTPAPDLLMSYLPDSRHRASILSSTGVPRVNIIEQPAGGRVQFPELQPLPRSFQDGIELIGYWLSQPTIHAGDRVYVRLFWRVSAQPTQSYTVFTHLSQSGQVAAGNDDLPGHGSCRTSDWRPGEVVMSELQLAVPADLADGLYDLSVGLYQLETMQRLDVAGSVDDQISLGTIEVGR